MYLQQPHELEYEITYSRSRLLMLMTCRCRESSKSCSDVVVPVLHKRAKHYAACIPQLHMQIYTRVTSVIENCEQAISDELPCFIGREAIGDAYIAAPMSPALDERTKQQGSTRTSRNPS